MSSFPLGEALLGALVNGLCESTLSVGVLVDVLLGLLGSPCMSWRWAWRCFRPCAAATLLSSGLPEFKLLVKFRQHSPLSWLLLKGVFRAAKAPFAFKSDFGLHERQARRWYDYHCEWAGSREGLLSLCRRQLWGRGGDPIYTLGFEKPF